MNALQQLIADYLADHPDETYTSIGRRGGIPKQTVQSLATKESPRQTPQQETLAALAAGLGMSEKVIRAAAADAAGFRMEELENGTETLILAQFRELDAASKADLERRLRHLAAEARERRDGQAGE